MLESYFGKEVTVTMDRPLGSKHPDHGYLYPVNYGYIKGTMAPDGDEVDAYIVGVHEPVETYTGVVIAIIKRKNDVEEKLVVANKLGRYTREQIEALVEFQERYFDSEVILPMDGLSREPQKSAHKDMIHAIMFWIVIAIGAVEFWLGKVPFDLMGIIVVFEVLNGVFSYKESKTKESKMWLLTSMLMLVSYLITLLGVYIQRC